MIEQSSLVNFGPDLPQRLSRPTQKDRLLQRLIAESMRVAVPAVVKSFTPGPPAMVTVQIATRELAMANKFGVSESIDFGDGSTDLGGTSNPSVSLGTEAVALPILTVPVFIFGAGNWSLTFPIAEGDECLLIFSDTSIDSWFQSGAADGPVNPISSRRHSLSDAIAIFGLRSTPNGLANYAVDSVQLRNDDRSTVIDLTDNQITITVNSSDASAAVNLNVPNGTVAVASQDATVTTTGDTTIHADGDAVVHADGNCTVHATGTAIVEGDTVDVNASKAVNITGVTDVNLGDGVTMRDFLSHRHSGIATGGSISGPVV